MQISPTFTASQYVKRLRMEKYGALGTCDRVQRKKGKPKIRGNNYTVLLETSCARMTNGMYASGDSVTLESKKIGEETIFDCPLDQHTRATRGDKFGANRLAGSYTIA